MTNRSTFVKVFTDLDDSPAWVDLDPEHLGLWLLALLYCRRNLTDGHFPARLVRRWGGSDEAAGALVDATRWHAPGHGCDRCPQPEDGQLYLHDFLEYQNSRAEVDELSAKRAQAGRRGGKARHGLAADLQEQATPKQVANQDAGKTQADASKPQPEGEGEREKDSPARARAAAVAADFESWWELYPRKVGKAAAAKAYAKARRDVDALVLVDGLANAAQVWKATQTEPQFIPHASTWLNAGRWADEVPLPDMPAAEGPRVTLRQCGDTQPHPRHRWDDARNAYGCMGVEA